MKLCTVQSYIDKIALKLYSHKLFVSQHDYFIIPVNNLVYLCAALSLLLNKLRFKQQY